MSSFFQEWSASSFSERKASIIYDNPRCLPHSSSKAYRLAIDKPLFRTWQEDSSEIRKVTGSKNFRKLVWNDKSVKSIEKPINLVLYLVGESPDVSTLKPTIVVECQNKKAAKKASEILEGMKQYGMELLLGNFDISYREVDLRLRSDWGSAPSTTPDARHPVSSSICGAQAVIVFRPRDTVDVTTYKTSTIGGAILLDGVYYALTTAHAFTDDERSAPMDFTMSSEELSSLEEDSDLDPVSSNSRSAGSTIQDTKNKRSLSRHIRDVHVQNADYIDPDDLSVPNQPTTAATLLNSESSNVILNQQEDWALIPIENPAFKTPNHYIDSGGQSQLVESIAQDLYTGQVTAVTGVSPRAKTKFSMQSLMLLPGSDNLSIVWSASLRSAPGDCGSWVVDEQGRACAMIVAASDEDQEVFCLPLAPIFSSIQRRMKTMQTPSMPAQNNQDGHTSNLISSHNDGRANMEHEEVSVQSEDGRADEPERSPGQSSNAAAESMAIDNARKPYMEDDVSDDGRPSTNIPDDIVELDIVPESASHRPTPSIPAMEGNRRTAATTDQSRRQRLRQHEDENHEDQTDFVQRKAHQRAARTATVLARTAPPRQELLNNHEDTRPAVVPSKSSEKEDLNRLDFEEHRNRQIELLQRERDLARHERDLAKNERDLERRERDLTRREMDIDSQASSKKIVDARSSAIHDPHRKTHTTTQACVKTDRYTDTQDDQHQVADRNEPHRSESVAVVKAANLNRPPSGDPSHPSIYHQRHMITNFAEPDPDRVDIPELRQTWRKSRPSDTTQNLSMRISRNDIHPSVLDRFEITWTTDPLDYEYILIPKSLTALELRMLRQESTVRGNDFSRRTVETIASHVDPAETFDRPSYRDYTSPYPPPPPPRSRIVPVINYDNRRRGAVRYTGRRRTDLISESDVDDDIRSTSRQRRKAQKRVRTSDDSSYPKKGKTRFPKRLVDTKVLFDLGYKFFDEDENFIVVTKALNATLIDEIITKTQKRRESHPKKDVSPAVVETPHVNEKSATALPKQNPSSKAQQREKQSSTSQRTAKDQALSEELERKAKEERILKAQLDVEGQRKERESKIQTACLTKDREFEAQVQTLFWDQGLPLEVCDKLLQMHQDKEEEIKAFRERKRVELDEHTTAQNADRYGVKTSTVPVGSDPPAVEQASSQRATSNLAADHTDSTENGTSPEQPRSSLASNESKDSTEPEDGVVRDEVIVEEEGVVRFDEETRSSHDSSSKAHRRASKRRARPSYKGNESDDSYYEDLPYQTQALLPGGFDAARPTYIKVQTRYLSPATLDEYRLPWVYDDTDDRYLIIKKYIDHELQDELFEHTRKLRANKDVPGDGAEVSRQPRVPPPRKDSISRDEIIIRRKEDSVPERDRPQEREELVIMNRL
ncbi:hypothetical protein LTS08_000308 [Lithohypha guttulata]|uniref:uncharacterized protein n=1 Tax=Lithohypha guttulata TaxID=1690604 RepID=UPI002DDDCB28|nr:hypothetical protein LTR51_007070 [Lithohypha guttulata]KAK5106191.1 hypothetical protein LTS08_000308 [Lithohypha guttulata]